MRETRRTFFVNIALLSANASAGAARSTCRRRVKQ